MDGQHVAPPGGAHQLDDGMPARVSVDVGDGGRQQETLEAGNSADLGQQALHVLLGCGDLTLQIGWGYWCCSCIYGGAVGG